jgi:hypothetical protein
LVVVATTFAERVDGPETVMLPELLAVRLAPRVTAVAVKLILAALEEIAPATVRLLTDEPTVKLALEGPFVFKSTAPEIATVSFPPAFPRMEIPVKDVALVGVNVITLVPVPVNAPPVVVLPIELVALMVTTPPDAIDALIAVRDSPAASVATTV